MQKQLSDISLNISEEEYRENRAIHYSTLSRFYREGFYCVKSIYEPVTSPSLTFGSMVDELLLSGMAAFESKFTIADTSLDYETCNVIKAIYDTFKDQYNQFIKIPIQQVSAIAKSCGFWAADKWSDNTRYNSLLKKGNIEQYYQYLKSSEGKTVVTKQMYEEALQCVNALRSSESTGFYFYDNIAGNPIQRYNQLKFSATIDGIDYISMLDLIVVDYKNKKIYPCDLKTTSSNESEFYKSFIKWDYFVQAKLYSRVLEENIRKDDYFKDFEIENFTFIVVNKKNLTPLTWRYGDTFIYTPQTYGKNKQIEIPNIFELAKELNYYLEHPERTVPIDINQCGTNSIVEYLNKLV